MYYLRQWQVHLQKGRLQLVYIQTIQRQQVMQQVCLKQDCREEWELFQEVNLY